MKVRVISLAVLLAMVLTTAVYAQKFELAENMGEEMFMERIDRGHFRSEADKFFTTEQKETIKKIRLESGKEAKPLKDQLRELKAHHVTLVTAENVDMNAIYGSIERTSKLKTELTKIRAKTHQEIRSLLTDEQLLKFDNKRGMMAASHIMKNRGGKAFGKSEGRHFRR